MTTFTYGSLFSGIGGIDLGLDRAGMRCEWQVEIDAYCTKVLAKHWPDVARHGDIRAVGKHNLAPVDLIAGGFPCQPHSLAGRRRASTDERDLWGEFYRVICELRPAWILAENVPGLLSSENGRFFGRILRDLAACGYDAEWQVLSAESAGAPHLRERCFIVGYSMRLRCRWQGLQHDTGAVAGTRSQDVRKMADPLRTQRWTQAEGRENVSYWHDARWQETASRSGVCGQELADPDRQSLAVGQVFTRHAQQELAAFKRDCSTGTGQWAVESDVGRVADGISRRVDRLRGLGNAVVPQVAEYVGRCILASVGEREAAS